MKRSGVCKLTLTSRERFLLVAERELGPKGIGHHGMIPNWLLKKARKFLPRMIIGAINELRRLELVWSGWGNKTSLPSEDWKGTFPRGYGLREVRCSNPNKLRLFFLSLLWRAAATDLPEFH